MKKKPENQVGFVCFGEINTPIDRLYLKHDEAFQALTAKVPEAVDCGLVIDDPESPIGGKAVAFETEPNAHGYLSLPFSLGVYDAGAKKTTGCREFKTIDTTPGYHWYTLENTTIPDNAMLYFTRAWQVQAPFGYPRFAGKKFDIRVAAKFEGPEYIPGSTAKNRIFIAGYELVPR